MNRGIRWTPALKQGGISGHQQIMEIFSQFAVELPITGSFFASKRGKGC